MFTGSTAGFFLGDGAGVGKGRQIAAMIKEHHAQGGKRTLWLSVSNDLRFDAERDLADVGAETIAVFPKVCCCWSAMCSVSVIQNQELLALCHGSVACSNIANTHRLLLVWLLTLQAHPHIDNDKTTKRQ